MAFSGALNLADTACHFISWVDQVGEPPRESMRTQFQRIKPDSPCEGVDPIFVVPTVIERQASQLPRRLPALIVGRHLLHPPSHRNGCSKRPCARSASRTPSMCSAPSTRRRRSEAQGRGGRGLPRCGTSAPRGGSTRQLRHHLCRRAIRDRRNRGTYRLRSRRKTWLHAACRQRSPRPRRTGMVSTDSLLYLVRQPPLHFPNAVFA